MPLSDSHHDPVRRKDCRYRIFAPRSPPTAKSAGREGSLFWREGFGELHRLKHGQGYSNRRTGRCLQIPMCRMTEEAKVRFDRQPNREVRIAPQPSAGGAFVFDVCAPRTRATSLSPRPIHDLPCILNGHRHKRRCRPHPRKRE
jgi:hypothetical protein